MKKIKNKKKRYIKNLYINFLGIISLIMIVFRPTSRNNVIFGKEYIISIWIIGILFLLFVSILSNYKWKNLLSSYMFCIPYLIFVSIIAQLQYKESYISLARIVPILTLLYLVEIRLGNSRKVNRLIINLLDILCLISIVWNIGILLKNQEIINFTYNNYNQYFKTALFYSVIVDGKPVMSFGVHTYASYFYFLFFILSFYTYDVTLNVRYLAYCVFLMFFTLFLTSTTSTIFCILMLFFIVKKLMKSKNKFKYIILFLLGCILIFILSKYYGLIYNKLYSNITNGRNSFVSRYSSKSVFVDNAKVICTSLGIGFNIVKSLNLSYSDSGYVVLLTMGSFPLLICIYYKIYKFLKINIPCDYSKYIIIVIFLFEFAIPACLSIRFIFLTIFIILYLNNLKKLKFIIERSNNAIKNNVRKISMSN